MNTRIAMLVGTCVLTLSLAAGASFAAFTVTVLPVEARPFTSVQPTQINGSAVWDFVVTTTYAAAPITVTMAAGTTNGTLDGIRILNVHGNTPQQLTLKIHGATANDPISGLDTLTSIGSQATVIVDPLVVGGDVGTIQVNDLDHVTIWGNLNNGIECLAQSGPTQSYLQSLTVLGSVFGAIVANDGFIGTISVGHNLGTHDHAALVSARDGITSIVAGAVEGTIIANNGGTGSLHDLHTTSGSLIGKLDFHSFNTAGAGPGIFVAGGNLDANVTIASGLTRDGNASITVSGNGLTTGLLPAGRTISVGLGLYGAMNFPANGLKGQVIINASGAVHPTTGEPLNPWGVVATPPADGPVTVGSGAGAITLQRADAHGTPYYDVPSSAVGGGAVGLVPFRVYANDCSPAHRDDWGWPGPAPADALLDSQFNGLLSGPARPVVMRFYGPVRTHDSNPGHLPFKVWRWVDVEENSDPWSGTT